MGDGLLFYYLGKKAGGGGVDPEILAKKADLVDGKVPQEQLPSYVDDVLEFDSRSAFPETGERGKIYVALDTNFTYRWSGTTYIQVGGGSAGGIAWGSILGTLSDQTDLQTALNNKQDTIADLEEIRDNALSGAGAAMIAYEALDTANAARDAASAAHDAANSKSTVSGTNDGTNWTSITIDGTTKNIPAGGSGGSSAWGQITGNLEDQIDLKNALDTISSDAANASNSASDANNKAQSAYDAANNAGNKAQSAFDAANTANNSISGLATVASTGDYDDLTNKPDLSIYALGTDLTNTTQVANDAANTAASAFNAANAAAASATSASQAASDAANNANNAASDAANAVNAASDANNAAADAYNAANDAANDAANKSTVTGTNDGTYWTSITIDSVNKAIPTSRTPLVSGTPAASVTIDPYKVYNFGTLNQAMSITLGETGIVSGYCVEYYFRFTAETGASITLPVNCKYSGGNAPTITAGHIYEFSIVDNLVVVGEFF